MFRGEGAQWEDDAESVQRNSLHRLNETSKGSFEHSSSFSGVNVKFENTGFIRNVSNAVLQPFQIPIF